MFWKFLITSLKRSKYSPKICVGQGRLRSISKSTKIKKSLYIPDSKLSLETKKMILTLLFKNSLITKTYGIYSITNGRDHRDEYV